jgi:hypothetical protein
MLPGEKYAAGELVARLHAELAEDKARSALKDYDEGRISRMEMLGRLSAAGHLGTLACSQGWNFLYLSAPAS